MLNVRTNVGLFVVELPVGIEPAALYAYCIPTVAPLSREK